MHETCAKCGCKNPEVIIGVNTIPGATTRRVLCLGCALEDSELLYYLGRNAVKNAQAAEAPEETTPTRRDAASHHRREAEGLDL